MSELAQEFSLFMDTGKMKAVLQRALPRHLMQDWTLTDCHIQHPRYKTYLSPQSRGKSFLALAYHLKGQNAQTQLADNKILYAKAYLEGRNRNEYAKARSQTPPALQSTLFHFEQYGMVAWLFPNDPALPWLPGLLDIKAMADYIPSLLGILAENLPGDVSIGLGIVNYRPETRCTLRYTVGLFSNAMEIYCKTFADGRGAEIYSRHLYFYQRSLQNTQGFAIAKPLHYDASLQSVWLQGISGKPLADALTPDNSPRILEQLANYLISFQGGWQPELPLLTETSQLAEIKKKCLKLQLAFPHFSNRLNALLTQLARQLPVISQAHYRLVHGDFHIQQLLLLDDGRLALFDFDELAVANPFLDVANFCADLYSQHFCKQTVVGLVQTFFSAFQHLSQNSSSQHFAWYLRIQLLTRAYRAYIQQKPNLEQCLDGFISAAESANHLTGKPDQP